MYPSETYPFWARLDEDSYDIGGDNPPVLRHTILVVEEERDDLHKFQVLHNGNGFFVAYASITPLCQVCDDEPAAGLGVYHPTTLLCASCLEDEPVPEWDSQTETWEPAWCDHGHAAEDVRRLPTGGDGAMLVCQMHYKKEMVYRAESGSMTLQEFPSWDSLTPYTGA